MNYSDREKVERLKKTFDLNYEIFKLYSDYLSYFPELITEEIVSELTSDGDITKTDAVAAVRCEAFGVDYSKGENQRRLIKEYIRPSVKILDTERYTENGYYKNIKLDNIKDGKWELKWESYPPYRAFVAGDVTLAPDFSELVPLGFFDKEFKFPAILEDGNEWMTLTPIDIDTCDEAIRAARGRVITFGLGLGYYAYMVSNKDDVESITVVDKSEEVISIFKKHILPQFPNAEKVNLVCADAFEYAEKIMPSEEYDYAFVDTWRDASDGAPMYLRMKPLEKLNPKTEFSYWIEGFLKSRLRAAEFEKAYRELSSGEEGAPKTYEEFVERLKVYG